jgi:hypothetical protein
VSGIAIFSWGRGERLSSLARLPESPTREQTDKRRNNQHKMFPLANFFTLYKNTEKSETSLQFNVDAASLKVGTIHLQLENYPPLDKIISCNIVNDTLLVATNDKTLSIPLCKRVGGTHVALVSDSIIQLVWDMWDNSFSPLVNIPIPRNAFIHEKRRVVISKCGLWLATSTGFSFQLCKLSHKQFHWKIPGVQLDSLKVDRFMWWNPFGQYGNGGAILLVYSQGCLYAYIPEARLTNKLTSSLCLFKLEFQEWSILDDTLVTLYQGVITGHSLEIVEKSSGPVLLIVPRWTWKCHSGNVEELQLFPLFHSYHYTTHSLQDCPILCKLDSDLILITPVKDSDPITTLIASNISQFLSFPPSTTEAIIGIPQPLVLFETSTEIEERKVFHGHGKLIYAGYLLPTASPTFSLGTPISIFADEHFQPLGLSLSNGLVYGLDEDGRLARIPFGPSFIGQGHGNCWKHVQHEQFMFELYLIRNLESGSSDDIVHARNLVATSTSDREGVFLDALVNVARKSESKYWTILFSKLSPTTLLHSALEKGMLSTAIKYLVVVQVLEKDQAGTCIEKVLGQVVRESKWEEGRELVRYLGTISQSESNATSWMDLLQDSKEKPTRKKSLLISSDPERHLPDGTRLLSLESHLLTHLTDLWEERRWKQIAEMSVVGVPLAEWFEQLDKGESSFESEYAALQREDTQVVDDLWNLLNSSMNPLEKLAFASKRHSVDDIVDILNSDEVLEEEWSLVLMQGDKHDVELVVAVCERLEFLVEPV